MTVVGASVHPGSRNIQLVRDEDIPAVSMESSTLKSSNIELNLELLVFLTL